MKEKKRLKCMVAYRQRFIHMLCIVLYVLHICKRKKIIMVDYEMLCHVEREKEKLTKLSSTKKLMNSFIQSNTK
jgi:hypothetical protein